MDGIGAFFPNPFAKKPATPPPAPAPASPAKAPAVDTLQVTPATPAPAVKPAATALVPAPTTTDAVLGVGSAAVGVGLAGWALATVLPAVAMPIVIGTAALGGVLALCGVGIAKNWGDKKPLVHALMTKTAGGLGIAGCMIGSAIAIGSFALSTGGMVGVMCGATIPLIVGCMGLLGYHLLTSPVPTPGLPKP